ncbi:MAG: AzlD domain-containing protein [Treponema sp.]|nr:AzlD domain-containing protein [Treponema sp.]
MNQIISLNAALIATVVSAAIIFATRAFPFVLFSKKEPPAILKFIERYIPPMVMAVLLIYCFKDVGFGAKPFGIPELVGLGVTVGLHLWRNNSMISIFGGTAVYMVLMRFLPGILG